MDSNLLLGVVIGWLAASIQARWKGVLALHGALQAVADSILTVEYCVGTGAESVPWEQLRADLERLRAVLIENPRFGNAYWRAYRGVLELSLSPLNFQGDFLRSIFDEVERLSTQPAWRLFLNARDSCKPTRPPEIRLMG